MLVHPIHLERRTKNRHQASKGLEQVVLGMNFWILWTGNYTYKYCVLFNRICLGKFKIDKYIAPIEYVPYLKGLNQSTLSINRIVFQCNPPVLTCNSFQKRPS